MASRALLPAIRVQTRAQRRRLWLLLAALSLGAGVSLLILLREGRTLLQLFSGRDLLTLLSTLGWLLLLLIPISGIYSLTSQFAFWEGWLAGLPQPADLFAGRSAPGAGGAASPDRWSATPEQAVAPDDPGAEEPVSVFRRRYLIYLDGIHQQELDHPPRVSEFLDRLEAGLPADSLLVRGLEAYTVSRASLVEDRGGSWFWSWLFALQEQHGNVLIRFLSAFLVQSNNVIKVGISSDRRYGPILNYELALKIATRLRELGFQPADGRELILLGYSGGGEMAMGSAEMLRRLCRSPVRIITFCGVFSANQLLDQVASITTIIGTRDPVAAFGSIAYPGRLPLLPSSNWNRQRRAGRIQRLLISGMSHNGRRGPFGVTHRDGVVQAVLAALAV